MSYTEEERRQIFLGQCFNNACVILRVWYNEYPAVDCKIVFELAKQLYDAGMKISWMNYGKKAVSSALTTGSNHLTDKEGKSMDPGFGKAQSQTVSGKPEPIDPDFKNKELIM